jgi:hypothetical protein
MMIRAAAGMIVLLVSTSPLLAQFDPDMYRFWEHNAARTASICTKSSTGPACQALLFRAALIFRKDGLYNPRKLCYPDELNDSIVARYKSYLKRYPERGSDPYLDVFADVFADFPCGATTTIRAKVLDCVDGCPDPSDTPPSPPSDAPPPPRCINAFCEVKPVSRR